MHIHQLDPQRHEKFLTQARIDPITGDTLEAGDKIVLCAECKSAFHLDSWAYFRVNARKIFIFSFITVITTFQLCPNL